ncbi:MAG TPA: MBL fold metallo-hydrolase [Candidatus Saccharimonadales bacterium]|jgi:cyclase|nr:MBL fold metallo-hydrolase [Candidatus Saccharimonadales bacterium]
MNKFSNSLSRRNFLAGASSLGALYAASRYAMPMPSLAAPLIDDPRIAPQPIANKGFASVRKIGNGLYATIADRSKGLQARCNGGFLIGRDSAIMLEGFQTTLGSAFQLETLRSVTQIPIRAAINTHWHFDHTLGNSVYGGAGIPIWAHADVPARIAAYYPKWQAQDLNTYLAPWQKRVADAKTDMQREHAKSDIEGLSGMFVPVSQTVLALPNHLLDPAKMPLEIDLGGLTIVVEHYIGHTDTDLIFRVPDQNVIYTGDLLTGGQYPVNINGYPTKWRETLAKFATFDKNTLFVPGHGPVMGQEGVTEIRSCFDDLAEQAEKSYKAGVPVEEAAERYVIPEKFKNYRMFSWGFTIGRTYEQFYAEWSGKPVKILNYS